MIMKRIEHDSTMPCQVSYTYNRVYNISVTRCAIFAGIRLVLGIDIDPEESKLYFTDYYTHEVAVMNLESKQRTTFISTGDLRTIGLVLDLENR